MEVNFDDPKFIKKFMETIEEMIDKKIRIASFHRSVEATVASTPAGGKCDIYLNGDNTVTITNVNIRPGLTISMGDSVYVLYQNNSKTNFFIDMKKP